MGIMPLTMRNLAYRLIVTARQINRVCFFRSDTTSFREGIKRGALLIVDFGTQPVDGSLVLCILEDEFRLMRLRLYPSRCLQELDKPERTRSLSNDDGDGIKISGVVTHIVNDARTGEFDDIPMI